MKNLEDILDQAKQPIYVNKKLHPTVTLALTFHNHGAEENLYVQFVYGP